MYPFIAFLGTTELIIILVIVVLIFGVGKLPEVGKHLGMGIRNFKSEVGDDGPPKSLESDESSTPRPADLSPPRDVTNEHKSAD